MRDFTLIALMLMVPVCNAQEKQDHPGYPPTMLLASASEKDGKVVIQMFRPGPVLPAENEVVKQGERFMTEWVPLREVTLGEGVEAFGVDGKTVLPKTVLKGLAKPRGVAVFMRNYDNDPRIPAPFYRNLIREGTILLVANPSDLYNPPP